MGKVKVVAKAAKTVVRSRSAITGQYVKPSYAKVHPRTTVKETNVKRGGK